MRDHRNLLPALVDLPLSSAKKSRAAIVVGPVVTGNQHEGISLETEAIYGVEQRTCAAIQILDDIAVDSARGFALVLGIRKVRYVWECVGKIEKKRAVPVFFDETNRLLGIATGETALVDAVHLKIAVLVAKGAE